MREDAHLESYFFLKIAYYPVIQSTAKSSDTANSFQSLCLVAAPDFLEGEGKGEGKGEGNQEENGLGRGGQYKKKAKIC